MISNSNEIIGLNVHAVTIRLTNFQKNEKELLFGPQSNRRNLFKLLYTYAAFSKKVAYLPTQ